MAARNRTVAALVLTMVLACSLLPDDLRLAGAPTSTLAPTLLPTGAPTLTPIGLNLPTPPPSPIAVATQARPASPTPSRPPTRVLVPTETPTRSPVSSSEFFSAGMRDRQNGYYARAATHFQAALNLKPPQPVARDAQFRLAESYIIAGDGDRAIAALLEFLRTDPDGARTSEVRYWLADIYRQRKDYANALAHMQIFRRQTQTLQSDADAALADIFSQVGDSANAMAHYDRALQDNTLAAATRANILMRAAVVHSARGESALAAARYDAALALLSDAPTRALANFYAGQAYAAAGRMDVAVARWNTAIADTPDQPGAYHALNEMTNRKIPVDDLARGRIEFHAEEYGSAIAALLRYIAGAGPRAAEARYFLARAYSAQGASAQAMAEYDVIINTFPKDPVATDAFMRRAGLSEAAGNLDDALRVYQRAATVLTDAAADEALLRSGLVLERARRYREAAAAFDRLQSASPARDVERAAQALFRAGLSYYQLQEFQTAQARWQLLSERYPQSDHFTAALYWLGKASMVHGQTDAAKGYWTRAAAVTQEVFKSYQRNYYAYRAQQALKPPQSAPERGLYDAARYAMDPFPRADLEKWLLSWAKASAAAPSVLAPAVRADLNFRRGDELFRLGRYEQAHLEFSALVDAWEKDPLALYALALYFQENGLHDFSIACAIRLYNLSRQASAPPAPRGLGLLRFPTYYADLVIAESKANGIDPRIYFALLRLESRFNPRVTGPAGERGLAQIGPHVAPAIAAGLQVTDLTLDQLFLPYLNVRFGGWLFAQNAQQLDDPIYAFAAYNAGLGPALRWQGVDVDLALEKFDIENARVYVYIVYPYWQEYQELYR
ncbi:MAG: tetratricopeptide repeat protein [Chloroflexi bacterium]|nr:tetratricopeptide repeat protein [Chloroflexota bacterium]